jgi:hypothetical protein
VKSLKPRREMPRVAKVIESDNKRKLVLLVK